LLLLGGPHHPTLRTELRLPRLLPLCLRVVSPQGLLRELEQSSPLLLSIPLLLLRLPNLPRDKPCYAGLDSPCLLRLLAHAAAWIAACRSCLLLQVDIKHPQGAWRALLLGQLLLGTCRVLLLRRLLHLAAVLLPLLALHTTVLPSHLVPLLLLESAHQAQWFRMLCSLLLQAFGVLVCVVLV
jgi:hypothetical protein